MARVFWKLPDFSLILLSVWSAYSHIDFMPSVTAPSEQRRLRLIVFLSYAACLSILLIRTSFRVISFEHALVLCLHLGASSIIHTELVVLLS